MEAIEKYITPFAVFSENIWRRNLYVISNSNNVLLREMWCPHRGCGNDYCGGDEKSCSWQL